MSERMPTSIICDLKPTQFFRLKDGVNIQPGVAIVHRLHWDVETRSRLDLAKVGAEVYAADPSTQVICLSYAIDDGPVTRWFRGDPVPDVWNTAATDPGWVSKAHNAAFEDAIARHILHPQHGFPLIPPERQRCTQAVALSLGYPAKLETLANALKLKYRKDDAGKRLMLMMAKPRKPLDHEDPNGLYWHEEPDQIDRLSDYNCTDVEVEREADTQLGELSDAEQRVWALSNVINVRGFRIDRNLAEAGAEIAKAAKPEIDDELAELTDGAVTAIGQIDKMKAWLAANGSDTEKLDKKAVAKLLEDEDLPPNVLRVLEVRLHGAQAAVKKLDALMKRAGLDDRIRGAFKFHGARTGRWAGEGYQPHNLKKFKVEDLDAAILEVARGSYPHLKALYDKPLSIVGDCSRPMIVASPGHELISADLSAIESRVLAWVTGEVWKCEAYYKFDETGDPRLEPYCEIACKIFGVPSGTYTKASPERSIGKTADLAYGYMGSVGAWKAFMAEGYTDAEILRFRDEWREAHPATTRFWYAIDRAAIKAVYEPGTEVVCGRVTLRSDGLFLKIRLPSGRELAYPNPRLICDARDNTHVLFDDTKNGKFGPYRGGYGAYGGTWTENIVSGISRDILVEAMFRIEAAGYPIVLHVHDEAVCEVPTGFGGEQEFLKLITQQPAWAPDLPIAANAWRGPRYGKSNITLEETAARWTPRSKDETPIKYWGSSKAAKRAASEAPVSTAWAETDVVSVSFTRFKSDSGDRLSKLYERDPTDNNKVLGFGGTDMARGEYEPLTFEGAGAPEVLAAIGARIETLGVREAIGLGIVKADQPATGRIITKAADERRANNPRSMLEGIPRAKTYFNWPGAGALGLMLIDGDEVDEVFEMLGTLCPDFAEVAALVRPSASASAKDPVTGGRLKKGEHVFVLVDDPSKIKACLEAILRLSWCIGEGRAKGWLGLSADGKPLPYGPCDVAVGSPERLVYEGQILLKDGLEHLPRNAAVIGGKRVLRAAKLIAFAEKHAPAKLFNKLLAEAKADPAFVARQIERKAAYKAEKLAEAVSRGVPLEVAEKEFERTRGKEGIKLKDRTWIELSPHDTIYFPDGRSFLASEMAADPAKFHGKEVADSVEGLSYKSRNPGLILHQGGRVEIISRAHADQFAYFLPLYVMEELQELLRGLGPPTVSEAAMFLNKGLKAAPVNNDDDDDDDDPDGGGEGAPHYEPEAYEAPDDPTDTVADAPASGTSPNPSDSSAAPPPSPKAKPIPLPRWMNAMLSIPNQGFFGKTYGPYTDNDTGTVYGPYKGREALLTAFLTRCVKEGIPDEVIFAGCIDERFKSSDGAIHTHCREQMTCRGDLEKQIALAKGNVASAGAAGTLKPVAPTLKQFAEESKQLAWDGELAERERKEREQQERDANTDDGGAGGPGGPGGPGGGSGGPGPQPGFFKKTKPVVRYGPLSVMADNATKVLIDAGVSFYQRGPSMVRPATLTVQSFHGTTAKASQLVNVSHPHLRDKLCQNSSWVKFDARSGKWKDIHPPVEVAQVVLERFGDWPFRILAGIISTPTMRADGSILQAAGYDPATQLLLIDPPKMPAIPNRPTREDAEAALALLKDLVVEFPFVDDEGVSRAVGLSAIISPVCRGAYPLVPVHLVDAPEAGTGKSYLLSCVSWIATGQAMPALGSDSQEELDKRLDAAVLSGRQLICIDNVINLLGGSTLCRLTEQPRPEVRIFGVLKSVIVDARSITFFANGNGITVRGDFSRRVIRTCLDALIERPSERQFRKPSPMEMILADRGKYIAACLMICRAYIVAGRPGKLPQLASYGEWSDTVRSALVWLGEADPVKSQDRTYAEDPERAALVTLANEWESITGAGEVNSKQLRDIVNLCDVNKATPEGKEYINKGLREAVLAVMPVQHRLKPDATELGNWLRGRRERRVGKLRFCNKPAGGHRPATWWVEREK